MNAAIMQMYEAIYTGSIPEGWAIRHTLGGEERLPDAMESFKAYIDENIYADERPLLAPLLTPEGRETIFKSKDIYEVEYLKVGGPSSVWKRCEFRVLTRDGAGAPATYAFSVRDIDVLKKERLQEERKKAERELMVNQAFENSRIMKFTLFVPERYGIASQGIEEFHGAPRRLDNMPDTFRDRFVRSDFHAIHDEMYARCFQGINRASCELMDIHNHWTRVTLEIIEKDAAGKPTIVLGIVENTDELHKARTEAAIMEEVCEFAVTNHYEEANLIDVQKNHVRSLLKTPKGIDVGFHHECEEDYDAGIHHLIRRHCVREEDRELMGSLLLENLVPILKEKGTHSIRCLMTDNRGLETWKQVECIFFKENDSHIIMLTTSVDEEEAIKQKLREAAEEAQEANHAKSAFLANMSHEIRTPMNAIVGISEILLGKPLPADVLVDINTIQNSGSSLLAIINDILDFSKIETGKFEITEVEYMLPSLFMDVSNVISVRLSGRPVLFMMDIDPALPSHAVGDDIRIKQILMNLIGNSVKFTHEGFIELRAEGHFLDDINYEMTFEVRDSGIGIKKEDFGKLFETFSQVDTRKNRAINGSGLGLSISKNLAVMMGGDLTMESEYGRGSVFTVRIKQKVPRYERIGEVHRRNVRMLIFEQNEMIIHSLTRTMEKLSLQYEICRESDKIRQYKGMTHVLIRRKNFVELKEKLEFMFDHANIYLVLENDEHAEGHYMNYKQLQLPLLSMQLINALNGEAIISSVKRKTFDRSQIVPLTFAHILLVDDNTTNLQVAQGLMSPYKMKIDAVTSGFKAIELLKTIRYDAIFMDHMMPDMDGIEATRYIRNMPGDYYKTVPIIALTANAMSGAREMFIENGMDDFVAKPIEMTELNRVLKRYVQSRAPEGYMEKMRESQAAQKGGKEEEALPVSLPESADKGTLRLLLEQNNALLSQNMLLLKHVLKEPAEEKGGLPEDESLPEPETEEHESLREAIPGVDMQKSVETYGGSVAIYHNILKTYYYDIVQREPAIKELYDKRDIHNFTIYVHAIKSASRGAGANDLGEMAALLEEAGKQGDWDTIRQQFPSFMEDFHNMVENVGYYVRKYLISEKKEAQESREAFPEEIVERLKKASEDMDYMQVEELLKELNAYSYRAELEEKLQNMEAYCSSFEYDKLDNIIAGL